MTLQDYLDEVKLRLNRYNVVLDSNDLLLMTYINDGRRNSQRVSLPYVSQRYGTIIQIAGGSFTLFNPTSIAKPNNTIINTYSSVMPIDCIDVDNVIFDYTDSTTSTAFRKEARRMDKEEVYNISMNNWNTPTIDRPTYTLEHLLFSNTPNRGKSLIVAGLQQADLAKCNVTIWYVQVIPELNDPAELEVSLSPDLQELAIYYTMLALVRDNKPTENYQTLSMVLNRLIGNLTGVYQMQQVLPVKELETSEVI